MEDLFQIDTSPTKQLLVSNLTRDATMEACVFDLVDNAIDAARNCLYSKMEKEADKNRLPDSYKGFWVSLHLDGEMIKIEDNCGGMGLGELSDDNLRFGYPSEHEFGIGLYGVGLNRAIFKLGNNTVIDTESETDRAIVKIDRAQFLKDEGNWKIKGEGAKATGQRGTSIEITNLDATISKQAADSDWGIKVIAEIEKRYARFLVKGLEIKFNEEIVQPNLVDVRRDGPYPPFRKSFKLDEETTVFIEAGQHSEHRFTAEPDYHTTVNRELSDEYGWSVVCNDRVIVHLDTSPKTGWVKKWHPEFNGFVGNVYFTSKNPQNLPWNTSKTDIDQNHAGYQEVLKDMQSFVDRWRNQANEAKKIRKAGEMLKPQAKTKAVTKKTATKAKKSASKKKPTIKPSQFALPNVLPEDIDEGKCSDKLLQLVHEGKEINIFKTWYSALALIRILFESCSKAFLIRHGKYKDCIDNVIVKRENEKGKQLTKEQKQQLVPDIEELIWLFSSDVTLWQDGVGKQMNQCLAKFATHKQRMNSAIHHPFQNINHTEVLQIRDEVLPMLRHLIEK